MCAIPCVSSPIRSASMRISAAIAAPSGVRPSFSKASRAKRMRLAEGMRDASVTGTASYSASPGASVLDLATLEGREQAFRGEVVALAVVDDPAFGGLDPAHGVRQRSRDLGRDRDHAVLVAVENVAGTHRQTADRNGRT